MLYLIKIGSLQVFLIITNGERDLKVQIVQRHFERIYPSSNSTA